MIKFSSMEEFESWLDATLDRNMYQNIQRMIALGMNPEQIAEAMPTLIQLNETARREALNNMRSMINEPVDLAGFSVH
jgi:hypothetical protein